MEPTATEASPARGGASAARALSIVAVLAALALCGWEGTLSQGEAAAKWGVVAAVAAVAVGAGVAGRERQRRRSSSWVAGGARRMWHDLRGPDRRPALQVTATAAWIVLVAATVGWDVASFSRQAPDLPTLSRLVGDVTGHDWGRFLLFALWLGIGCYVALGGRLPAGRVRSAARRPPVSGTSGTTGTTGGTGSPAVGARETRWP